MGISHRRLLGGQATHPLFRPPPAPTALPTRHPQKMPPDGGEMRKSAEHEPPALCTQPQKTVLKVRTLLKACLQQQTGSNGAGAGLETTNKGVGRGLVVKDKKSASARFGAFLRSTAKAARREASAGGCAPSASTPGSARSVTGLRPTDFASRAGLRPLQPCPCPRLRLRAAPAGLASLDPQSSPVSLPRLAQKSGFVRQSAVLLLAGGTHHVICHCHRSS